MPNEFRVAYNGCSVRCFQGLPGWLQDTIVALQSSIERSVLSVYPQARATSGFRCHCENSRVGGKPHSRHLFGLARDYAPDAAFPDRIAGLKVIRESACVHVEVIA